MQRNFKYLHNIDIDKTELKLKNGKGKIEQYD